MNRQILGSMLVSVCLIAAMGCSGKTSPVFSDDSPNITGEKTTSASHSQTHLWGLYDVYIDVDAMTVVAIPSRQAMFTANVVNFLNGKATSMIVKINNIDKTTDYTDIDIDVTLKHPFPGLQQYNGYDVRGVFMGDGSGTMAYNSDLIYPAAGVDQIMLPNPAIGAGGPDGYTRWFNKPEFSNGGMPLVQYTQGKAATPGYSESATLNAYQYFADDLLPTDNLWDWLNTHADQHGVFSSGVANTRNYYLRFPVGKGMKFAYAVLANWAGPAIHPSNAPEAVALSVADNSTIYYVSSSDKGGDIKLNVSVWNWGAQLASGVMDEYMIKVESTVLSSPWTAGSSTMTPIGGGVNYSTYQLDIPADNIQSADGQSFWVIVEESNSDYTNDFGVTNLADKDPLAALFQYSLHVGDQGPQCPVPDPSSILPGSGQNTGPVDVTITCSNLFNATGIQAYLDMSGTLDGTYDIAATNIKNVDVADGKFDCTFDLTNVPLGPYYVIVTNECGETGVSTETLFTVIENLEGDFYVSNSTDFSGLPEEGSMVHPYHTIQKAIDAAVADGTDIDLILVDYGTGRYPEYLVNSVGNFTLRAYNWHSASGRPAIGGLDVSIGGWPVNGTITFSDCSNVTVQGFKLLFVKNSSGAYISIYHQYNGTNIDLKDNWFSGNTQDGMSYCAAITMYTVDNMVIENNLFKGLNMPHPVADGSGVRMYIMDFQGDYTHTIVRNEITHLQWDGPSDNQDIFIDGGYAGGCHGNYRISNNLYHHVFPDTSDAASFRFMAIEKFILYYDYYDDPIYPFEVSNNVIDNIDITHVSNQTYWLNYIEGILNNATQAPSFTFPCHSNILTNFKAPASSSSFSIASDYPADNNDLWNLKNGTNDAPWGYGVGSTGVGNIAKDPMFVNNTTEPYDYHLATGSPCIGAGKDGKDMGVYGNLNPGEKIGLLTPAN
jgi:hypothetical protein